MGAAASGTESVYASRGGIPGGAGLARALLGLAESHHPGRSVAGRLRRWLRRVRSSPGHVRGGSMNAIEVRDVRKVYRRYGRRTQFGTLKSALLSRGRTRESN